MWPWGDSAGAAVWRLGAHLSSAPLLLSTWQMVDGRVNGRAPADESQLLGELRSLQQQLESVRQLAALEVPLSKEGLLRAMYEAHTEIASLQQQLRDQQQQAGDVAASPQGSGAVPLGVGGRRLLVENEELKQKASKPLPPDTPTSARRLQGRPGRCPFFLAPRTSALLPLRAAPPAMTSGSRTSFPRDPGRSRSYGGPWPSTAVPQTAGPAREQHWVAAAEAWEAGAPADMSWLPSIGPVHPRAMPLPPAAWLALTKGPAAR